MCASMNDVPSEYVPPEREKTGFDWRNVAVETSECIACGRALLSGERTACVDCKKLADRALRDPVARAQLQAMAYAD
jgi:hypothetical protein